jgi:hypothetical protein
VTFFARLQIPVAITNKVVEELVPKPCIEAFAAAKDSDVMADV